VDPVIAGTDGLNFVAIGAPNGRANGGTLRLGGANAYAGTTTISGPANQSRTILRAGSAQAFGPPASANLQFIRHGGQETLIIDLNGFDQTVSGLHSPAGNDGAPGDGGGWAFGCYVGNMSTNPATLTINNTADCAFLGSLRQNPPAGSLALTKDGPGMLTLQGGNTYINYSGRLTVKNGTLNPGVLNNINSDGSLGNSALSVMLGTSGTTGTLITGTGTSDKPFTLSHAGTGAFRVDNGTMTLNGIINGGGNLVKRGNGTLVLSQTCAYTGNTRVDAGILTIAETGLADASAVYLTTGAVLNLGFSGTDNVAGLYFDGALQASGTWGALGSGADHESPRLTGTGMLDVSRSGLLILMR
ncbi:MAG: autotransporter-associated beta strand protein, partial [Kiritimatiellia bacterium]